MSGQINFKVRRVRCPKCRNVLTEPEGVPLYRCGACNTVLQAKKKKKDTPDTALPVHGADPKHNNNLENTNPITDEFSTDTMPERVDSIINDRRQWPGGVNQSNQLPGSDAISYHETEASSSKAGAPMEGEEGKLPSDQNDTEDIEYRDDDRESVKSASSEIVSSFELNHHESNSLVPKFQEYENGLFLSSPEKGIERRYSSVCNSDGEKQGSDSDLENASQNISPEKDTESHDSPEESSVKGKRESEEKQTDNVSEIPSPEKETESRYPSEDNCDGGKQDSENDEKNAFEVPSTDGVDLKVIDWGESSVNQSHHIPYSDAISGNEIAGLSLEDIAHTGVNEGKFSLDQYGREAHSKSANDDKEQSDDISDQYDSKTHNKFRNDDKVQSISIPNEVLLSPKVSPPENHSSLSGSQIHEIEEPLMALPKKMSESQSSLANNIDGGEKESESSQHKLSENTIISKVVSSSHRCTSDENEDPRQVEELKNMESLSIAISASGETMLHSVPKDPISIAHSLASESISVDNFMSPHRESMNGPQSSVVHGLQRESSDDNLEIMPRVFNKGDFGVKLRSPTAKNYYASDGGASSSNETDDQVPHRRFHQPKRFIKDGGPSSTKVLPKRDEFVVNHTMRSDSELQGKTMNSASILEANKHSITKGSRLHQGQLLEGYRHPVPYMMWDARTEYKSRVPFSENGPHADYKNSGSSSYGLTDYNVIPDNPHELHRLELLNMVYELQDQLKRVQMSDTVPHRRFSTGVAKDKERIPLYKDSGQFAANRDNYLDLNSHRYSRENIQDTTWLQTNELKRTALSNDPMRYMHPQDCSCLRCRSQEQYYSAQLPPHVGYNNEEHSMASFKQNSLRSYHSASSSPQYYTASESSVWNRDSNLNDQRYQNYEVEKIHQIAKRHFQPIAGGAPIIACYCCTEIVQLPADFLLFRRKCHWLKCGVCSEVLKFSLENKIHVVRYNTIPTSPPSEFSRSYSTGDNFSVTPPVEKLPDHIRMSSGSSFGTEKEGKKESKHARESVKKYKNSTERFEAAESSSKMPEAQSSSSEIEVESPFSSAALHKLMGYSSISRLIYE